MRRELEAANSGATTVTVAGAGAVAAAPLFFAIALLLSR
ncbi:hypothetical protein CORAM0001_2225 [Corynebacterium amycolatum SK46]|nr:hypothetical protein CORAM0001_2225 [Corynebacterium amycolatum SK46]